jgi:hypothetical protein
MEKFLFELLLKIYMYYPVGMPHVYRDFPGYKLYMDKLDAKIDMVQAGTNHEWINFVEAARLKCPSGSLSDLSFQQFPSYIASIVIEKNKNSEREFSCEIVVVVSLLADYYTIYLKDSYKLLNYTYSKEEIYPINYEILYYESAKNKELLELCDKLKLLLESNFSKYKYVSHHMLLNSEIQDTLLYGRSNDFPHEKKYSIYELLFDTQFFGEKITFLE